MHHVTILNTTELVDNFERSIGYYLTPEDHFEIFNQLFQRLDESTPFDLSDKNLLSFESFVFANHLTLDHATVNRIAYRMLVPLWQMFQAHNFYTNGALMYFPFSMNGRDLCVRRYNS